MRLTVPVVIVAVSMAGGVVGIEGEEAPVASGAEWSRLPAAETWGFEPDEGFVPGCIEHQVGWNSYEGTAEAHIDTANPHTGTQHLRISHDPAVSPPLRTGAVSPWVPDPVFDSSSMSVWVAIGDNGGASYRVRLLALFPYRKTGEVLFDSYGNIRVYEGASSFDTGFDWTPGSYVRLVVDVDPIANTITYRYGGNQIYSTSAFNDAVIETVHILSDNQQAGEHGDFDDLIIERGSLVPILHRWSFAEDGSDSVGGAHAILHNGAAASGGELVLDGIDDYAELPIEATLSQLTDVSVEMWVTWAGGRSWERFFDFGTDPAVNWFMTPRVSQNGRPRVAITTTGEQGEQRTDAPDTFPFEKRTHVVYTLDGDGAADQARLYIDGILVAVHHEDFPLDPAELGTLTNIWLGRSQYAVDPFFMGAIDEFVIHGGVLSDQEVLECYQAIFSDGFESGDTTAWSTVAP
jgi:hypothetical protein